MSVARGRSIGYQILAMRSCFPQFQFTRRKGSAAIWVGTLQPRDQSPLYKVKVVYSPPKDPRIWVLSPVLKDTVPHRYRNKSLCLYYPKDYSWTEDHYIAATIIPWTAEWLLLYEVWDKTGTWYGPEAPHPPRGK